jgi:hypothetical protein
MVGLLTKTWTTEVSGAKHRMQCFLQCFLHRKSGPVFEIDHHLHKQHALGVASPGNVSLSLSLSLKAAITAVYEPMV